MIQLQGSGTPVNENLKWVFLAVGIVALVVITMIVGKC